MNNAQRARKRFNREHRKHLHHNYEVLVRGGKRMAILRPFDPVLKMKMVDAIPQGVPGPETDRAWEECLNAQPHRFMGMACKGQPFILDPVSLKVTGKFEPGDSFIDYDELQKHPEAKISEEEALRQMQESVQ
jgi:hypothetical protein